MHGRPRVKKSAITPEKVRAAEQKAVLFGELCRRVFEARKAQQYDEVSLKLSEKLLAMNPEMYTVWNYRREYLDPIISDGGEKAVEVVNHELGVTEKALMQNPKSYSTYHHRRWLVSSGFCSLEHEISLVERLLDADERNFHGWGYRRAISKQMGLPVSRELEYSRQKIEQNFSNYSAWHHRSTVLPLLNAKNADDAQGGTCDVTSSKADGTIPLDILEQEFLFVRQACFTDPLDQSGWFYHRWLMGCLVKHMSGDCENDVQQQIASILLDELQMCYEVHELEPDAKWPVLTSLQVERALKLVSEESLGKASVIDKGMDWMKKVDALRINFYCDVANRVSDPWSLSNIKTNLHDSRINMESM